MRDVAVSGVILKSLRRLLHRAALVGAVLGLAASSVAAPPENADPAYTPWFRSLRQPGTGISCCSAADCRVTEYRVRDNGYEALIEGLWRAVPWERVLDHIDNPTGRAVVCYLPSKGVLCFVRPSES